MLENIEVLYHSSIKINKGLVIYIDPFKIHEKSNDADLIFITHDHYDHYSEDDIDMIKKDDTVIVVPKTLLSEVLREGFNQDNIIAVEPNREYFAKRIKFETVPAYNINKSFHPKGNGWGGYIIELEGNKYYIAGDTDATEEAKNVKCDVAFVPVGGTYTMDSNEAAELVNVIKPKIAVPIHYGSIVGTREDAENFVKLLNEEIKGRILL